MSDRDEKILRLYRDGLLIKAIAEEVGMAPNSVGHILKRLGVERPPKPQKRWRDAPEYKSKVRELWDQGLCASQIAERLVVNRQLVESVLIEQKIRSGAPRHRYDGSAPGGSGRDGFAGNMARKT